MIAASLVVGGTIAATTTPSAFAVAKKGSHNNVSDKINGNGNTDTDIKQKCKQFGSGFDYSFDQDCQILSNSAINVTPIAGTVTGSGIVENTNLNNRLNCPNGSALSATITFHASETNGGVVYGTWTISDARNAAGTSFGIKSGTFGGGDISRSNYHLTGVENVDEACSQFGGGVVPNPVTISGQCGTGVAIEFLANQLPQNPPGFPPFRESGTFTGNVNCVVS
jgi:hypothetical protein